MNVLKENKIIEKATTIDALVEDLKSIEKIIDYNTDKIATKANQIKVELIGLICSRSLRKTKTVYGVKVDVSNVIPLADIQSDCIKGIRVGNEILFTGENDKKYRIELFSKKAKTLLPADKIAGMTTNKSDIEMLKRLRKNKDYFSFSAVIDPRNLNKFLKIYDVQKIEDVGGIKKIKKLLKKQTVENA